MGYSRTGKGLSDSDSRKKYAETGTHDVRDASGGQSQTYSHFLKTGEAGKTNFGGGVVNPGSGGRVPVGMNSRYTTHPDSPFFGGSLVGRVSTSLINLDTDPRISWYPAADYAEETYGIAPPSQAASTVDDAGVVSETIYVTDTAYGGEGESKTGLYLGVSLIAAALYISRRKQ